VAVGAIVAVGGTGVAVGGTAVAVGGIGVAVLDALDWHAEVNTSTPTKRINKMRFLMVYKLSSTV
jgi:hypothetical protein